MQLIFAMVRDFQKCRRQSQEMLRNEDGDVTSKLLFVLVTQNLRIKMSMFTPAHNINLHLSVI